MCDESHVRHAVTLLCVQWTRLGARTLMMRCMSGDCVCCVCVIKAMCVTLLCVRWTRLGARTLMMRCMSGDYVCCVYHIRRVGQNCKYTTYLTVYLVIFLPKATYTHRIYIVLANPTYV